MRYFTTLSVAVLAAVSIMGSSATAGPVAKSVYTDPHGRITGAANDGDPTVYQQGETFMRNGFRYRQPAVDYHDHSAANPIVHPSPSGPYWTPGTRIVYPYSTYP
jgi:hypothetical protein